jgi:hypothetical protein
LRVNNFGGKIMVSSRPKVENCEFIDWNFDINDTTNNYNNSVIFIASLRIFVANMLKKY